MRKTIFIAAICAFSPVPSVASDWRETCAGISSLAVSIMDARQKGAAMSDAIRVAKGNKLAETMVMEAYDKPRYSTKPMQQRTIEEFRDEIYAMCAKGAR